MSAARDDGGGSGSSGASNLQSFQTSMSIHRRDVERMQGNESGREVVQRSGLFGKSLIVERESCVSINSTMRSNHSYRTNEAAISNGFVADKNVAPPQQATWIHVALIMMSECIGAGVLTLSQKYAEMGWILSSLFMIVLFAITVFSSHVMVEVKKVFPGT